MRLVLVGLFAISKKGRPRSVLGHGSKADLGQIGKKR